MSGAWKDNVEDMVKMWHSGNITLQEILAHNVEWARMISMNEAARNGLTSESYKWAEDFWKDWDVPRNFAIGDMVQRTYVLGSYRIPKVRFEGCTGLGMIIDIDADKRELVILWHIGPHIPKAEWEAFHKARLENIMQTKPAGRYPHPQRRRIHMPAWKPPATDYQERASMLIRTTPSQRPLCTSGTIGGTIVKWDIEIPNAVS